MQGFDAGDSTASFDEISQWNQEVGRAAATTLYQKHGADKGGKEAQLSDFDVKKVIGRGSFGKVFLVQHKAD